MRGITIYSKNAGVEILGDCVERKDNKYGSVTLRFFEMENGKKSLRFIMNPIEAFTASLMVSKVASSGNATKLSKTHKFEGESGEVITTLTFEKWVRENKSGYALLIKRDRRSINVPVDEDTFFYLGEFLKYLSTQQAWVNPIETAEENTEETADDVNLTEPEPETAEPEPEPEIETVVEIAGEPEPEPAPAEPEPEPTPAPTPTSASSDLTATGVIEAVRRDGKGIKIGDSWYSVNDRTKVSGVLKRGSQVKVTYRNGNGSNIKFANIIEVVS